MFQKIKIFFQLFKAGKQVTQKNFWLQQQSVVLPVVVGLLMACVKLAASYGYNLPLDENMCYMVAGTLYFAINSILLFVTNKRLGMPQGTVGETESSMPQPISTETQGNAQQVPSEPVSSPSSRFDEETLARANEWLQRQRLDDKPGGVFYSP